MAVDDDGRVLACKRAGTAAEGARLRHEAALLARLRRPGIVDLVRVDGSDADEGVGADDHGHALYTAFVGTRSLDTAAPLPVEHAAELVARLAMVVADLHERGIVHGRIDPSHVLVGTDGAPVLCGFSGAGARGSAIPDGPPAAPGFRDPCALVGGELTDSIDVYGLGALLRDLVIGDGPDPEPIPERRFRRRRDARWTGYLRRALLTLADQATDDQPSRRPTARRLAHDIRSLLDPATERDEPVPAPVADDDPFAALRPRDDTGEPPRRRSIGLLVTAAGVVLVVLGLGALTDRGTNAARTATLDPHATLPSSTTASTTTSTTTSHSTTVVGNSIDLDDGTLIVGGHRYAIGDAGDEVVLGDWDCDGTRTAALLRPSTGDVFVFDAWPADGGEVRATPVTTVGRDSDLRVDDVDGCSALRVVGSDGTAIGVPT